MGMAPVAREIDVETEEPPMWCVLMLLTARSNGAHSRVTRSTRFSALLLIDFFAVVMWVASTISLSTKMYDDFHASLILILGGTSLFYLVHKHRKTTQTCVLCG